MIASLKTIEAYKQAYAESLAYPEQFWARVADHFLWKEKWTQVLRSDFDTPRVEWFINGKLNITENCLDRHLADKSHRTALIWEPNNPADPGKYFTYGELYDAVCRFANVLKAQGVQKGDRVCIYMPMIPELVFAALACARLGAIHAIVFAGFSANALAERIEDTGAKILITADGFYRGAKEILLQPICDQAIAGTPTIEKVLIYQHLKKGNYVNKNPYIVLNELLEAADAHCEAAVMDSEDPLFILYTSGSTGKPKGVVHTCGGYMVYTAYTFQQVFDYHPQEIFWCTADAGWITGHSYLIYGPLLSGATTVIFEGIPTWPDPGRFWQTVDKLGVNIFYTAPTAIRSLMLYDLSYVTKQKLDSLRVIGTVGEPINAEAWHWYDDHIGKNKCPLVDTWWQTETGGIMISNLAGIGTSKPTFAGLPLPGVAPVLVDSNGEIIEGAGIEGNLCISAAWPAIIRTTYRDHARCKQNYFSTYRGLYFTGDSARRDEDGYYRIIGRVDDVINVSGHRLGTAEIENAINESDYVIESAVVGYPHDIKGQGIYAYVICNQGLTVSAGEIRNDIIAVVNSKIGPIAKPDKIQIVSGLPKTRSGKIMRRILRKIAANEVEISRLGDTTTLTDPAIVEEIIANRL